MAERASVVVIGAGPVGLFTALALHARGVRPVVLEKRACARAGSRSIGVHPPSLELLDVLGLGPQFLARGVRVRRGLAFGAGGAIGTVSFARCPGAHPYVLTIAQEDTEAILTEALEARCPGALRRGIELAAITPREGSVELTLREGDATSTLGASAVIGCDGRRSAVRAACSIASVGVAYEGAYAMVDVPDTTDFGDDAAIFLGPGGLVESFPMLNRWRRWVIRRDAEGHGEVTLDEIADTVARRTGHRLPRNESRAPSAFLTERALATELARGRVALAGDAAHVVSPIGGQGMNLGWRGAASLVEALCGALARDEDPTAALATDAVGRARAARAAARRAELNMWLGRPTARATDRDRMVAALLVEPLASVLARAFTMRGLEAGV